MAILVAVGVALTGERRVLGLELSPGSDEDAGARCGGAERGEEGRLVDVEEALLVVPILTEDAHRE